MSCDKLQSTYTRKGKNTHVCTKVKKGRFESVLKSLLSQLTEKRLREKLLLSSCLLQQINKFGLEGGEIEMSAYFKSRTFYSVHFPLAGLLLAFSLSLTHYNILLTDLVYNGVNDKTEATDKSIMESV